MSADQCITIAILALTFALIMVAAGMYRTGAITLITEKLIGRLKSLLAAQAHWS